MSFKLPFFYLFLFIFSFFFLTSPPYTFTQTSNTTLNTDSSQSILNLEETTNSSPEFNIFEKFWNWLFGLFVKTDYSISIRSLSEINSDMSDYGDKNDSIFSEKRSFTGSRLTSSVSQTCFKGNVIKKVILNSNNYPDSLISRICISLQNNLCSVKSLNDSTEGLSCQNIYISNLAHYFVQSQQNFYCFSEKNQLTNIDQEIVDKVNQKFPNPISPEKLSCYQDIYQDLYLTPKETTDNDEENTKKMIQTPISNKDQKSDNNHQETINQLNQNFIPEGSNWNGLNSLRPESW